MTFGPDEPRGFHRFLNKFRILDEITWDEELIDDSIAAASQRLAAEQIDYALIDFSVNKYMPIGWHKREAIRFVYDSFAAHRPGGVGLVLAIKYESLQANQRQYAKLIDDPKVADCLVGLDLVGDECQIDHDLHGEILRHWIGAGRMVRAHVGEYGPVTNVEFAIKAGVTNIAHGLAAAGNADLLALARDSDVCFDLGLTSNFLTGVAIKGNHPLLKLLASGIKVTLGTDDPVICETTLNQEFETAAMLGATAAQLLGLERTALDLATKHGWAGCAAQITKNNS